MKSVIGLLGESSSTRRSATVTSSAPEAASASAINSGLANLPVPTMRRERNVRPPSSNRSVTASATYSSGIVSVLRDVATIPAREQSQGKRPSARNGHSYRSFRSGFLLFALCPRRPNGYCSSDRRCQRIPEPVQDVVQRPELDAGSAHPHRLSRG